jgi:hypothetical protein
MRISPPEGSSQDPSGFLCSLSAFNKNYIVGVAIAHGYHLLPIRLATDY